MRKKKIYNQVVKGILRPEITQCLECQRRLQRCVTIADRMVITLKQVIRLVHCGYRCPKEECPGRKLLYRSMEADALVLSGFSFGLDSVLLVGHPRLREHKTVDEIHQHLSEQLAPLEQTISRREILFLFEAYTALLRAGTEVYHDEAWKEQVRKNKGILLSIDGIQPDKGNETIYLVRDVFTGRMLHAENVTESTKERLKQILSPVLFLNLPVIGVISDAQPTHLQAVAELWPNIPHQICQFHALREAGRLIYTADHRVKTDMRISMQEKTHDYRQNLHKRLREAEEQKEEKEQSIKQLHILEEYAATVEGALNLESKAPFQYGGLAMQEALSKIQASEDALEKGGAANQTCKKRLTRLKTIVSLHEEKKDLLAHIKSMREWVLEVEHIFDGSWASQAEEIKNVEVARRFDAYARRVSPALSMRQNEQKTKKSVEGIS